MLFADTNSYDVWVAVVAVIAAAVPLLIGQRTIHKTQKDIKSKVYTNHGKNPAEYLEMIAEVKAKVDSIAEQQERQAKATAEVVRVVEDHTLSDLRNFNELAVLIQGKADK